MLATFWDARAARIFFTALIFVLVLAFLHAARQTLTLFVFAILFAYLVEPLVERFQHLLRGRIKAISVVYLLILGVVVGFGFLVGPVIVHEGQDLVASIPALIDRVASGEFIRQVGNNHGWTAARETQIQHFFIDHRIQIVAYAQSLAASLAEPATHIWWLILIPILSLFFLKDGSSMASVLVRLGRNREERLTIHGVVEDVNIMLGSYIRAQLILAALTMVVLTLVLALMHVPYAFILGPVAGVCEFIPVVGPAVASAVIFGIGILSGYSHLVWLFLMLGTWRVIQDYINAPRIMGKSLEISPLLEIFGVLAGGEIGGVVGALVSVPVLAIFRILWKRLSSEQGLDRPAISDLPQQDLTPSARSAVSRSAHASHPPASKAKEASS